MMRIERAYLSALTEIPPDPLIIGPMTSTAFRKMIESFLLLFATYLPENRQIVARYFLDAETVCQHFCRNQIAEAELKYFSWPWRYACLLSTATAIFGKNHTWGRMMTWSKIRIPSVTCFGCCRRSYE